MTACTFKRWGKKNVRFFRQATSRKFSFSLFSLLCHTGATSLSFLIRRTYVSASAPKGHTQLHCKWCKLQAEKCVFGRISTLGWHLATGKKTSPKSPLCLQEKVPEPHAWKRKAQKCKSVCRLAGWWVNETVRTSIRAKTIQTHLDQMIDGHCTHVVHWLHESSLSMSLLGKPRVTLGQTLYQCEGFHALAELFNVFCFVCIHGHKKVLLEF